MRPREFCIFFLFRSVVIMRRKIFQDLCISLCFTRRSEEVA